jgi:nucleotide-binding universal stress UspA family protein
MIFQKILVPLDGSEHSERALEAAVQLAKKFNSKLALLTVYSATEMIPSPEFPGFPVIGAAREWGGKILAEAEQKVKSETIEVETELTEGNAVERIVEKSKEGKFDLIVMGARGLSTIEKILIGSVSEGVIKNAPCPVLIVK